MSKYIDDLLTAAGNLATAYEWSMPRASAEKELAVAKEALRAHIAEQGETITGLRARIAELEESIKGLGAKAARYENDREYNAGLVIERDAKIEKLTARIEELEAATESENEAFRRIMAEECPTDERHCTCVPLLRSRITELEHVNDRQREYIAELERPCVWREDSETAWISLCGIYGAFEDGTPEENGAKFCMGCGRPAEFHHYGPEVTE